MERKGKRLTVVLLLALAMVLALSACGGSKEKTVLDAALEDYRGMAGKMESYFSEDAAGMTLTGKYQYALVLMDPADAVPTLLLKALTEEGFAPVKLFRYGSDRMIVGGGLQEGATASGWNAVLSAAADGAGLLYTEWYEGGDAAVWRNTINAEGDGLDTADLWHGSPDGIPEEYQGQPIVWYNSGNLNGLDSWTPPEASPSEGT